MAAPALVLYVAIHKDDTMPCIAAENRPRRYLGGRHYIGLRERQQDALERASLYSIEPVSKTTHVLLEWRLSSAGLVHFGTTNASAEHRFAPMLSKNIYSDDNDWNVWHFL